MRHRGRVDGNHAELRDVLRSCGASVASLANLGGGVPDLLVGFRRRNRLVEVKLPGEEPSELQQVWHREWRGEPVLVAHSIPEVLRGVGLELAPLPTGGTCPSPPQTFGAALRDLRVAWGVPLSELAAALRTTPADLGEVERGHRPLGRLP